MIDPAKRLDHRQDFGFLFIGRDSRLSGPKADATMRYLSNTLFFYRIDPGGMLNLLGRRYMGLPALDHRYKIHNFPGKLPTYLLIGLPILIRVSVDADLALQTKNEDAGRICIGDSTYSLRQLAEESLDPLLDYQAMSCCTIGLARKNFLPALSPIT